MNDSALQEVHPLAHFQGEPRMKPTYKLLAVSLFFTTIGFLLGHQRITTQQKHSDIGMVESGLIYEHDIFAGELKEKPFIKPVQLPNGDTKRIEPNPSAAHECHSQAKPGKAISEVDLNKISDMLTQHFTNEDRVNAFNTLFETNARTPEIDSDSALAISDFFRQEKSLENFIPQQVACHSNLCKVDFPSINAADANQLIETLSKQLSEQKIKASHILLADDTHHGSTKIYVSLLSDDAANKFDHQ